MSVYDLVDVFFPMKIKQIKKIFDKLDHFTNLSFWNHHLVIILVQHTLYLEGLYIIHVYNSKYNINMHIHISYYYIYLSSTLLQSNSEKALENILPSGEPILQWRTYHSIYIYICFLFFFGAGWCSRVTFFCQISNYFDKKELEQHLTDMDHPLVQVHI